jgi:hypothetical protein
MSVGLKANVDGSGAIQVGGSDAITLSTGLNATFVQNANLPNTFGFKNRIINGDMRIDQRNAGASVTPVSGQYLTDRWVALLSQVSKFTAQQNAGSVTPPTGFINYQGITSSSAYSVLTADVFYISQYVEGLNISDLAWGTANAATVTLSFWVRSSLTGTFGGALNNSAYNRSYPFTYTISSANTWEQKSVTIAGDTSGTWLTTNGVGIRLNFGLGCGATYSGTAGAWAGADYRSATGATSVVGTNGATFYITGVQLEKGSTATSFDYLDYGRSLIQCQRYYEKSFDIGAAPAQASTTTGQATLIAGKAGTGTQYSAYIGYKAQKRDIPSTVTFYNPTNANAQARDFTAGGDCSSTALYVSGTSGFTLQAAGNAATTVGNLIAVQWSSTAEL